MGPKVSHLLLTILLGIFGVNEENEEQTIVHLGADDIRGPVKKQIEDMSSMVRIPPP